MRVLMWKVFGVGQWNGERAQHEAGSETAAAPTDDERGSSLTVVG